MTVDLPRVLTICGATRLGITRSMMRTELRRGRWQRLAAGVLLTRPDAPTRTDWAEVGLALSGDRGVLSGWDAVRLRGLGSADPCGAEVVVLTREGHNRRVGPVRLRPSQRPLAWTQLAWSREQLGGARVATTSRAVADTALQMRRLSDVRALVTAAVQRGLATPDDVAAELESGPQQGSALLRHAVADLLDGARSVAEAEAVDLLRRRGVPPFEVNVPILDEHGQVVAVADILWRALRAVLEIDSREFHFAEPLWKATMRRHNLLLRLGYATAHYPPSEIRARRSAWADEVARWLARRAREVA